MYSVTYYIKSLLTHTPNPWILENVHSLDDYGVLEFEVLGHSFHLVAEGHFLEVGLQIVKVMSDLQGIICVDSFLASSI